jgi:hypothetical protein
MYRVCKKEVDDATVIRLPRWKVVSSEGCEMAYEKRTDRYDHTIALLRHGHSYKIQVDAIRENDGPRVITNWRFDLIDLFKKHHPKYIIMAANFT